MGEGHQTAPKSFFRDVNLDETGYRETYIRRDSWKMCFKKLFPSSGGSPSSTRYARQSQLTRRHLPVVHIGLNEWPKILPTIPLIRVNSSWGAPSAFSGTAWAQVTNVEGVKPQDWPVKNAELAKTPSEDARFGRFSACQRHPPPSETVVRFSIHKERGPVGSQKLLWPVRSPERRAWTCAHAEFPLQTL